MSALISIIIPTYNHAKEIHTCLESIFRQTYKDYEIIVINDGSIDNTLEVLKKYQPKIKIINQENRGAPVARSRGFEESTGEYVIFCDADLILKPKMLEKMVYVLDNHPQASYVYSSFRFGWKMFKLWPFDAQKLKQMNYIHSSALIKRKHFPGWDESLKKFQDWDLWLTMLEQGHIGVWIPEILFKAKPRKDGMSKWFPKIFYKIPWKKIGISIKELNKYEEARKIIRAKHNL